MIWISTDILPEKQMEVVFFSTPYEWRTGIFTPKGWTVHIKESVFQCHEHWGDDGYHTVENVTHWMELPPPPKN